MHTHSHELYRFNKITHKYMCDADNTTNHDTMSPFAATELKTSEPKAEIGCKAGYFVGYCNGRGFVAR